MQLTTEMIAEWTGGRAVGPPAAVDGAGQDSRTVTAGQLFVPIVAERDGHAFIDAALQRGAGVYLTQNEPVGGTAIVVPDTLAALARLATEARRRFAGPVIGVTGSVGKTSTKDLLAAVLNRSRRTAASDRSFNNEIGVPLTVLNTPDDAEAIVIEMGARGLGHVASLCAIATPTIGVVTTVAAAHTGEFGSIAAIADAKGELVESLPSDGLAVLNADVELVDAMRRRTPAEVIGFGRSERADVRIVEVSVDAELRLRLRLHTPWGDLHAAPTVRGVHLAPNVAAAAAVALWLGDAPADVAAGLESAELSPWRMEVLRASAGGVVINDAYNANPSSMRGALDSLAVVPADRKVAVLGYMAELDHEDAAHLEVAEYARRLGVELVPVGTDLYGVEPAPDPLDAVGTVDAGTAVLVKGSRVAGLEVVAAKLAG